MRAYLLGLVFVVSCSAPAGGLDDGTGGFGGFVGAAGGESTATGGEAASTGGSATGGEVAVTGGASTGGVSTGGTSTGGATGGTSTGGSGTGGSAPVDSDGDGVPDAADVCPGHDDNQDLNGNGKADLCEPGWCHYQSNPDWGLCNIGFGYRQGYCSMDQNDPALDPGECVKCGAYFYDCNDDWSDGCEKFSSGAHPCFVEQ